MRRDATGSDSVFADAIPTHLPVGAFYGAPERALASADCRVTVTSYARAERVPRHAHSAPYLSFVMAGSYAERVGPARLECPTLALRFHPRGEEHENHFGAVGGRCFNVELSDRWNESLELLPRADGAPVILECAGALGVKAVAAFQKGEVTKLECVVAELLALCDRAARRCVAGRRHPGIRRALEFVDANVSRRISLIEVATVAELHPTHFARTIRALTGATLGEHVRGRRLAKAETLLAQRPAATLSTIAAECGFADHAHLTRVFRRMTGVAPRQLRAALRQECLSNRSQRSAPQR